jgi:hypothetical protein
MLILKIRMNLGDKKVSKKLKIKKGKQYIFHVKPNFCKNSSEKKKLP